MAGQAEPEQKAITTADQEIPLDELTLMLEPMSKDELFIEADGWLGHVKEAVENINAVQLEIKRKARAAEANQEADPGEQKANEVTGDPPNAEDDAETDTGKQENKQDSADAVKTEAELSEDKAEALDRITQLNSIRTERIDRLNKVLDQINAKIGKNADGTEQDEVLSYRRYIKRYQGRCYRYPGCVFHDPRLAFLRRRRYPLGQEHQRISTDHHRILDTRTIRWKRRTQGGLGGRGHVGAAVHLYRHYGPAGCYGDWYHNRSGGTGGEHRPAAGHYWCRRFCCSFRLAGHPLQFCQRHHDHVLPPFRC